jgi:LmbE family N-acetylglucosaminyl deacetylase
LLKREKMTKPTILLCYAHPDDESFGTGGMMAHFGANGAIVALVCATRGEVGEISDPALATPDTLPQVREAELRCACDALHVSELIFLDYRDSGMVDTPPNQDPRAFMNQPAEAVVPRLVGIIRRLRPQVVITFDPTGGYGHPDHLAIHRHTVAAFHAAADPAQFPEQGAAWQAARLLYGVIPRGFFAGMRAQLAEMGVDTSDWDDFDEREFGWPDDQIDFELDVSDTVAAKWAALECHRTQFGADNPFNKLPEDVVRQMMSREFFVQAWPETKPGTAADVFAGLLNQTKKG